MTSETLSPSALGTYEICGRRGQYYHARVMPRINTVSLARGSAWHWMMETYQRSRMWQGVSVWKQAELHERLLAIGAGYFTELMNQPNAVVKDGEDPAKAVDQLNDMLIAWLRDPGARWDEARPIAVEAELRFTEEGVDHTFHGFLDLAVATDRGTVLVDHKTAGRAWGGAKAKGDPRQLPQAPLYAEAWERETGERVDWFAYDVMTQGGRFDRVWVDVSHEKRAPFIAKWADLSRSIRLHEEAGLDMPANPTSFLCSEKWCDYWTICPMGAPEQPVTMKENDNVV